MVGRGHHEGFRGMEVFDLWGRREGGRGMKIISFGVPREGEVTG